MIKYETNPLKIREKSSRTIKDLISLDHLSEDEQLLAIQMIQASGDISMLNDLRFSESLIENTLNTFSKDYELLADSHTVICGLAKKYLPNEPICFIDKASVISQAKSNKKTRSMTAIDLWKPYLAGSIILIGSEPTALFRLLEMLEDAEKNKNILPSLIIATPAGFSGALEAKERLWEVHEKLGISCITLLGTKGGSHLAQAAINTLFKRNIDTSK